MTDQMADQPQSDHLSPLDAEHRALGAAMTSFAGFQMPLRYTSDVEEHRAVRSGGGLFDLSHMGEIVVTGPGAGAALDRSFVSRVSAVAIGRAKYTLLCAPDGGILDDVIVYRLAAERFLVIANASNTAVVLAELVARAAPFDAQVADQTSAMALLAVQGPLAEQVVTALAGSVGVGGADALLGPAGSLHGVLESGDAIRSLRYYASVEATIAGVSALVARTGYTGEDGFELLVAREHAVGLWREILTFGRPLGLLPCGLSSRDSLRLEAGMPLYGNELDRTTTPYDAGLGRTVVLDRDDFVGREALSARAGAQPARQLVGLRGLTRRAARHGYPVLSADGTVRVGEVTSGAPSPTLGYPVAMAYVTPEVSATGTELTVDVRGRAEQVRVEALPFYRRPARP